MSNTQQAFSTGKQMLSPNDMQQAWSTGWGTVTMANSKHSCPFLSFFNNTSQGKLPAFNEGSGLPQTVQLQNNNDLPSTSCSRSIKILGNQMEVNHALVNDTEQLFDSGIRFPWDRSQLRRMPKLQQLPRPTSRCQCPQEPPNMRATALPSTSTNEHQRFSSFALSFIISPPKAE